MACTARCLPVQPRLDQAAYPSQRARRAGSARLRRARQHSAAQQAALAIWALRARWRAATTREVLAGCSSTHVHRPLQCRAAELPTPPQEHPARRCKAPCGTLPPLVLVQQRGAAWRESGSTGSAPARRAPPAAFSAPGAARSRSAADARQTSGSGGAAQHTARRVTTLGWRRASRLRRASAMCACPGSFRRARLRREPHATGRTRLCQGCSRGERRLLAATSAKL